MLSARGFHGGEICLTASRPSERRVGGGSRRVLRRTVHAQERRGSRGRSALHAQRGQVLAGRFAVESLAGTGGMGAVYRACDLKTEATRRAEDLACSAARARSVKPMSIALRAGSRPGGDFDIPPSWATSIMGSQKNHALPGHGMGGRARSGLTASVGRPCSFEKR